ncbi:GDSL-type esterase/lipase family protein [Mesobacillus foraminis]|uniref:GDSL-type esterase/lipase family protein n=1 Tax=Mesobacillus foraminis TaxID=279826 RepID=UPI001C56AD90|nr:GDSL-type esterase/lipase family protein [Mesobacillus foraminis]
MDFKRISFIIGGMVIALLAGGYFGGRIAADHLVEKTLKENYQQRVESWQETNKTLKAGSVVFLGDSLVEFFQVNEYFEGVTAINRGIKGDTTEGVLKRMKESVHDVKASKVFLLIGTNDLGIEEKEPEYIVNNIGKIVQEIRDHNPGTKIYIQSLYPVNHSDAKKIDKADVGNRTNKDITLINEGLKKLCEAEGITYIDVYSNLLDEDQMLDLDYTREGLHLNGQGYQKVVEILRPYIEEA